jgi:3,4-dihydroxy 2-butanone 4-phosphate synthase/GTP cyclohydrolase II
MIPERLDYLRLHPMTAENTSQFGTAFTESIDAMGRGVTTGISAYDRAQTILAAIDPGTRPGDLARPGHIFPLRARKGGVLVRAGQTEASVDMARMAGMVPAGVICEIMKDDGTMARIPDLVEFCRFHDLKMLTVAELIRYRMQHERYVERIGEALLPAKAGGFRMIAYRSALDSETHVALVHGDLEHAESPVLVRMHTHCLAGDVFDTNWCECGEKIRGSMRRIVQEGTGAIVYLHYGSPGFSVEKIEGNDVLTFHRELKDSSKLEQQRRVQREVGIGAQILQDLKLHRIRLLTNHPRRVAALEGYGIEIVDHVPLEQEERAADVHG